MIVNVDYVINTKFSVKSKEKFKKNICNYNNYNNYNKTDNIKSINNIYNNKKKVLK